jgi:hypothetical protein
MKVNYFDVHVFLSRHDGYSIPVKIEIENDVETVEVIDTPYDDDEVIFYAVEHELFTEEGDENHVDRVDEIDEKTYNEMKGRV